MASGKIISVIGPVVDIRFPSDALPQMLNAVKISMSGGKTLTVEVEQMIGTGYQNDVPPIGRLLSTDDTISFGSHKLTTLPTPGHTRGSVSFYCQSESIVFTGDTLFHMSIGRTDFPGGSWQQMADSLKLLATLPDETKVYSGHGEPTTIGEERQYNPYISNR